MRFLNPLHRQLLVGDLVERDYACGLGPRCTHWRRRPLLRLPWWKLPLLGRAARADFLRYALRAPLR